MNPTQFAAEPNSGAPFVSSRGHLALVLCVLLGASVAGAVLRPLEHLADGRTRIYVQMVAFQWVFFGLAAVGVRRHGLAIRTLLQTSPLTRGKAIRYSLVSLGGLVSWFLIASILGSVLRPDTDDLRLIQRLLPHTVGEVWLWLAISLSAGFCEEFLFRGYLLRQFQALTGSLPLALTLQALVYGAVHLVLPYQLAVSVTVLALLLGTLAVWQKSLLPGMIVHAAIDLAGGLLSFAAAPHGSA